VKHAYRSVFFGTPEIAVPALKALADTSELVGVVCQPDRPKGRGLEVQEPATKRAALELGVPVHQPLKVKTGNLDQWLLERSVDVALVFAYGRILPEPVLVAPRRGCMNLHASLLPKYRGAAPIEWAIAGGESETGISLMQMDVGLDTGPVFTRRALSIGQHETSGELAARLAELAAVVVREDLPRAVLGELHAVPQDDGLASLAPPLQRDHGRIDWSAPAVAIDRLIRAMTPRPGAHTKVRGKLLKIVKALARTDTPGLAPGTVAISVRGELVVGTGQGSIAVMRAQLEGRKALDAVDLVNGRVLQPGDVLG
jgi:methionyl-tRNA formyltransferase